VRQLKPRAGRPEETELDITNHLKKRLISREKPAPAGTWFMCGAPQPAEAIGHCGYDFLVVDMEHVPVDVPQLADILRAVATTPSHAAVRIAWNDKVMIKRVLDSGAETIIVPFVQNAEEARQAVAAAKYPPLGVRGVAAVQRASRFGAAKDYLQRANDETCVIAQLETLEAVGNLGEIAAVDGLDGIFVGPNDLAASMGRIGGVGDEEVQRVLKQAAETAAEAGIAAGALAPSVEMAHRFIGYGYSYVAIASDLAMMMSAARGWLADFRKGDA
jgi:2-keto-3-deoxy-L-rhamnonate aldolase RhmA